ncbi:MAG TPA: DUF1415 domain-containing protein [Methylibium sp.]|nr:DUF1415 domain-containing protein [Methylibium sp.]
MNAGTPFESRGAAAVPNPARVLAETRAWLERAVIGLNLCPFARAVHVKQRIRWVVSTARDTDALLAQLCDELDALAAADPERVDTTLLIHPAVLADFGAYNDFLAVADAAVAQLGHAGVLQVASFHPDYRFADAEPDDIANATNRSPWPMLHLLREDSIDRAVAAFPEAEAIYAANIATLHRLGAEGWAALQAECRREAESDPTP